MSAKIFLADKATLANAVSIVGGTLEQNKIAKLVEERGAQITVAPATVNATDRVLDADIVVEVDASAVVAPPVAK